MQAHTQIITRPRVDDSHLDPTLHPVIKQIYAARQVKNNDELNNSASTLHDFRLFKDIDKAAALLVDALTQQQRILIVGDFDADGATSTATLMQGLGLFGFTGLDYLIPDRFNFGYGLSAQLAEHIIAMEQMPDLVITVDSGISCLAGIARLKAADIKVLVTDHHLQGEQLPNADAIVNPNRHDCAFPSKSIAGVGVAFYLLIALRHSLREQNWFATQGINEPNLAVLLDLVALGTVADVVALDANNRTLVHQGLARIRSGHARVGIVALIEVAKRNMARLSASDFGFSLAPRLNAAGRLDDMSLGIECLLATNMEQARGLASELDTLNYTRREIEQGMQQEAQAVLARLTQVNTADLDAICLYQPDWHQGVIGILAGRLKDSYHRPSAIFAQAESGELKGSCRSIEGLHMRDLLANIDAKHPDLMIKFGGHAMAAGLSIHAQQFEQFKQVFTQQVSAQLSEQHKQSVLLTDGELPDECFTLEFADLIKRSGPWGQQFPEPVFEHTFTVVQQRIVGEKHLKLMLKNEKGTVFDAISFNVDIKSWPDTQVKKVHVAYQLDINEYRGQFSLQLLVRKLTKCA